MGRANCLSAAPLLVLLLAGCLLIALISPTPARAQSTWGWEGVDVEQPQEEETESSQMDWMRQQLRQQQAAHMQLAQARYEQHQRQLAYELQQEQVHHSSLGASSDSDVLDEWHVGLRQPSHSEPVRREDVPLSPAQRIALRTRWGLPRTQAVFASAEEEEDEGEPAWRKACANRCEERNMEVTGVGLKSIPSDKAEVRATIEARRHVNTTLTGGNLAPDELSALIATVQTEVSTKASDVIALLSGNGTAAPWISKLRTSGIGLEPLWEYTAGRQLLVGYRASNSIVFRVDVARAGDVIDLIVEAGVTRIDGVSFVASADKLNAARHRAIQAAVEDAIEQIIRMDIQGVTRPEATSGDASAEVQQQGMMAPKAHFRTEALMSSTPVEGEEKVVGATVSLKVRF